MNNKVEINLYEDGYRTSEINCIDIPLASCAGHYRTENYFLYCLCYCYLLNWHCFSDDNWYEIRNRILEHLGLSLKKVHVSNLESLSDKVIYGIDSGYPVFFVVKYGALFYSKYYKWGTYDHGIIVSDYDTEKEIFGVRDREGIREYIESGIFKSDIMHRNQIESRQLQEIWDYSNQLFRKENSPHLELLYYIVPFQEYHKKDSIEMIKGVLDHNSLPFASKLEQYIFALNKKLASGITISDTELEATRRIYYRSFLVFRNVIDRVINSKKMDVFSMKLHESLEGFLKKRLYIFDLLQLYVIRRQTLNMKEMQLLLSEDTSRFKQIRRDILEIINSLENSDEGK